VILYVFEVLGSDICLIPVVLRFFAVSLCLSGHVPGYISVIGYDLSSFHVPSVHYALFIVILDTM
jgi:hypothetical protein